MSGVLWAATIFVAFFLWVFDLRLDGYLSDKWAAGFIFAAFVLIAIAQIRKRSLFRTIFDVGIPLGLLFTFIIVHARGNPREMMQLAGPILTFVIVVAVFYKIISSIFGKKK